LKSGNQLITIIKLPSPSAAEKRAVVMNCLGVSRMLRAAISEIQLGQQIQQRWRQHFHTLLSDF
jgi:hypothetical protein